MSTSAPLPPYSEKHLPSTSQETSNSSPQITHNRIAGTIQTCSIRDFHVDYLKITRDSATHYTISLTTDPTPLYHLKLSPSSSKIGDIQLFPASSDPTSPPVAAARLSPTPKSKDALATICTSSPANPDAIWRPFTKASRLSVENYHSNIPIITVPGLAATPHRFAWWTNNLSEPFYQLWWEGPLPHVPGSRFFHDQRGSEYVFATVVRKGAGGAKENYVEIRRGGGLEFEFSVLLEVFVVLGSQGKELL